MRSLMRAALVVAAVTVAVPAIHAQGRGQGSQTEARSWTVISLNDVPMAVRSAQKKAFPAATITKAEQSGRGETLVYRLSMTGKQKDAMFDARGKMVK